MHNRRRHTEGYWAFKAPAARSGHHSRHHGAASLLQVDDEAASAQQEGGFRAPSASQGDGHDDGEPAVEVEAAATAPAGDALASSSTAAARGPATSAPDRTFCHSSRAAVRLPGVWDVDVRFCYYTASATAVDHPDEYRSVQPQLFADYGPYTPLPPSVPAAAPPTGAVAAGEAGAGAAAAAAAAPAPAPPTQLVAAPAAVPRAAAAKDIVVPIPTSRRLPQLNAAVPPPAPGRSVPSLSKEAFGAELKSYGGLQHERMPLQLAAAAPGRQEPAGADEEQPATEAVAAGRHGRITVDNPEDYVQHSPTPAASGDGAGVDSVARDQLKILEMKIKALEGLHSSLANMVRHEAPAEHSGVVEAARSEPAPAASTGASPVRAAAAAERPQQPEQAGSAAASLSQRTETDLAVPAAVPQQQLQRQADVPDEAPPATDAPTSREQMGMQAPAPAPPAPPADDDDDAEVEEQVSAVARLGLMDAAVPHDLAAAALQGLPGEVEAPIAAVDGDANEEAGSTAEQSSDARADLARMPIELGVEAEQPPEAVALKTALNADDTTFSLKRGSIPGDVAPVAPVSRGAQFLEARHHSSFMDSDVFLQLASERLEPRLAGARVQAPYHSRDAFGWDASDVAQGIALDVPKGFTRMELSGSLTLADVDAATNATVQWAVLTRSRDEPPVLVDSGSFDVQNGRLVLARHKQFYRRLSARSVPVAVGGKRLRLDGLRTESQIMVWMRPTSPVTLQVLDELVYTFDGYQP